MQEEAHLYFQLMWLYVGMIIFLMLLLCYLYFTKQRAQKNERMTLAFSQHMIEGMELERHRISRELHDVILPQVYELPVSDQIRIICKKLLPPDFDHLSLSDLFTDLCGKLSLKTGIQCNYFIENDLFFTHMSMDNQLHLYRMVQESFTNIDKHSKAKNVFLSIRRRDANILICISDDGIGLENAGEGLGLMSIRQRAAIIDAKVDFISQSGNGLMVRIEFPPPPPPPSVIQSGN